MEVKVNKEIREYTEAVFFGLSLRQFIFSACACGVAVLLYFSLKQYIGLETLSWICIFGAIPFATLGFIKFNGMPAERFVIVLIRNLILTPKQLKFRPENLYYKQLKPVYEKLKKEGMRVENGKKVIEERQG